MFISFWYLRRLQIAGIVGYSNIFRKNGMVYKMHLISPGNIRIAISRSYDLVNPLEMMLYPCKYSGSIEVCTTSTSADYSDKYGALFLPPLILVPKIKWSSTISYRQLGGISSIYIESFLKKHQHFECKLRKIKYVSKHYVYILNGGFDDPAVT